MRVFKNTWFVRFAKREKLNDDVLRKAVEEAEHGVISADLGGHIIKQRIARTGQGKSGGYRTIIIFQQGKRHFLCMDSPKVTERTSTSRTRSVPASSSAFVGTG